MTSKVILRMIPQGWLWYVDGSSSPNIPRGPFPIEALARKDAYFYLNGWWKDIAYQRFEPNDK